MSDLVGTVETTEWLTPSMVRIGFGGSGLGGFSSTGYTDEYVNALFVPGGAPYAPPFDVEEARATEPHHRPRGRRLTVRRWEPDRRRLTIDIVTHGEVGSAGRWAHVARPGDLLQMAGPAGGYRPDPDAAWYLFGGDESALPAIAACLEAVPAGRPCVAVMVVDTPEHHLDLASPGDLTEVWLHRVDAEAPADLLPDAMAALDWLPGSVDVFVHGEAGEVRATRRHLIADRGVDRQAASISPYWRRGDDDEAWRRVKGSWLAEQEDDV